MKAAPARSAAPTTRQGRLPEPTEIIAPAPWPLLPDAKYFGPIIAAMSRKSPFGPRRRPEPRDEWKLYVHVRLEDGDNPEARKHLESWRAQHEGHFPVVFVAIPFRTLPGTATPEAPHLRDRMYKLIAMASGRRLAQGDWLQFEMLVGLYALVLVRTCTKDQDGDPVARSAIYSYGRKILALKRVADPQPLTEYPPPSTHYPFQHPEESQGVENDSRMLAAGRGVAPSEEAHSQHDRLAGEGHSSSTASPTPSSRWWAAVRRVVGDAALADIRLGGPCPHCGEAMATREYSSPWCPLCDVRKRRV